MRFQATLAPLTHLQKVSCARRSCRRARPSRSRSSTPVLRTPSTTFRMELRKAKAAAIWCDDVDAVRCFADEQATAKGDFPGPLPVVYTGADRQNAMDAGAAAVVADAGDDVTTRRR